MVHPDHLDSFELLFLYMITEQPKLPLRGILMLMCLADLTAVREEGTSLTGEVWYHAKRGVLPSRWRHTLRLHGRQRVRGWCQMPGCARRARRFTFPTGTRWCPRHLQEDWTAFQKRTV